MKFLIVIPALVALIAAKPADQNVAVSQDTAGNYRIAINLDGQSRLEQGNADGTVSGSYSFVDANGVLRNVQYTAGPDGFRAVGDALPVAPVDHNVPVPETPEVAKGRAVG
ncbi:Chitin bind 4 domain containing protein [Asbolus verrucosus]|uniref:Chitin bind 4 domain containing protein n=1 Tax=Asbolus verrucosus TaxID=1661398 RepID=A0A482VLI1_ASBVE|nr:Chitin bind 4 domain containing protein [Asbolus verrucosus]